MALTIEKLAPGRGANDIRITYITQCKAEYFFLTSEALEEIMRWSLFYGDDAKRALLPIESGDVINVG